MDAFLVFFIGLILSIFIGKNLGISYGRCTTLYVWHALFCMAYFWYSETYGGDANGYYFRALQGVSDFYVGTVGVTFLTAIFANTFGLSLVAVFFVFNFFGLCGVLLFDASLRHATRFSSVSVKRLATVVIFLPSVSFWSSAIGKDSLSFLAAGLALWASINLGRRMLLMIVAILIMLLVRPHIAGVMIVSLSVALLHQGGMSFPKKLFFSVAAISVTLLMIPFALDYAGVQGDDIESLTEYVETRQSYNMSGGGGLDISQMILPVKLFTYMFRPLFFDANSIFALAASVDNFILLYLFIKGGRIMIRNRDNHIVHQESRIFLWSYAVLSWIILAMTTSNLGIAMRQKWMLAPMLIFLLISVIGQRRISAPLSQVITGRQATAHTQLLPREQNLS